MRRGLVVIKGGWNYTLKDALNSGTPLSEQNLPTQPPTLEDLQQQQQEEEKPYEPTRDEIDPPVVTDLPTNNTCPEGYTYALGYCVRNVNYYGCIPGEEYWDGSKCSRNWPVCGEGIYNDLNTGQCLNPPPKPLPPALQQQKDELAAYSQARLDQIHGGPVNPDVPILTPPTTQELVSRLGITPLIGTATPTGLTPNSTPFSRPGLAPQPIDLSNVPLAGGFDPTVTSAPINPLDTTLKIDSVGNFTFVKDPPVVPTTAAWYADTGTKAVAGANMIQDSTSSTLQAVGQNLLTDNRKIYIQPTQPTQPVERHVANRRRR